MGKEIGTSWLILVKRAFRSPTKEEDKKSCRRRKKYEQEEKEKKGEKRRWLFRKSSTSHLEVQQYEPEAVAAKAAVETVKLTRAPSNFVKEHWAAIVIQKFYRGHLAKKALRALKGLVKLQALGRGHIVRKRAKITLQCLQALVRVQDRVCDQRARLTHEGGRKSTFVQSNNAFWQSRRVLDERDDLPYNSEEIEAIVRCEKEAALKRDEALAYAFSNQIWRSGRNPSMGNEEEPEERARCSNRWSARKKWENSCRSSSDRRDTVIKTVEVDTPRPYNDSYSSSTPRGSQYQQKKSPSPLHKSHYNDNNNCSFHQSPITPSLCKIKPIQVRSASPHCLKEEPSFSAAHSPCLGSKHCVARYGVSTNAAITSPRPNYMAATESAKARIRSQCSPRVTPLAPEREREKGGFSQNVRSPSFRSVCGHLGMEQRSNCFSCNTKSLIGREISRCSTTDLRWLK